MLSIWIATDSFDKSDIFDRLNSWFTLLSVVMCVSLLLGSVLAWLRFWKWESDACSIACQILSAVAFLIIFGIIVLFLFWIVFLGFQTIAQKELDNEIPFLILVSFSWVFGSFFACTLRQKSRVPLVQAASWRDDNPSCDVIMMDGQPRHGGTRSSVESTTGRSSSDNISSSEEPSTSNDFNYKKSSHDAAASGAVLDVEANIIPFVEAVLLEDPMGSSS
eukprot:CAMPEP_0117075318 /NCGR_PEP_ID=MMETSP0472-20121206/53100_1 /TAXON_ID=693140 ORGANISM="Tiarina fusus, Strain LIS" /NCGR_SAMPLE_ID=MMETSP0472 /ASSEMBLY_ACC=CAM_ASM_000603 /LENGTH=219 /DNA_ID=CAMNT_0004800771 /DNA_START=378 /DNA_END=1038 /DNA_ORIENTATION=+